MKNALYIACDTCAKILDGKQGTAKVNLDYICLRGSLCLNQWNEDEHRYNFYYAAQKNDLTFMHFCNGTCLEDFLESRKALIVEGRKIYEPETEQEWNPKPRY